MGNFASTASNKDSDKKFDNFYDVIDYLATYYILKLQKDLKIMELLS